MDRETNILSELKNNFDQKGLIVEAAKIYEK